MHMTQHVEDQYRKALDLIVMTDLAEAKGRAYRTLQAYRKGDRRITNDAARELVEFLREQAESFTAAADALEAALTKEGGNE